MTMERDAKSFKEPFRHNQFHAMMLFACVNVSQLECYHNRYYVCNVECRSDVIQYQCSMSIHGESVILKRGVRKKLISNQNRKQSGQNSFLFINRC